MLQLYLGQQADYMLCDITVHSIVDAMRKQHSRSTLGCRLRVLELDDGMIGDKGKRHNALSSSITSITTRCPWLSNSVEQLG